MAPSLPPFAQEHELNQDLALVEVLTGKASSSNTGNQKPPYLPGHPRVLLGNDCLNFLNNELLTPELDTISSHLWLVATQRSDHVSALHHQIVRGRSIIITEDPKLHLLWIDDRVYIKPIPSYLLNYAFWVYAFSSQYSPFASDTRNLLSRSASGFLRTYAHLVKHESDFRVARELCLIPSSTTWIAWNTYISGLSDILDDDVSARYHFGELRLSRLNFWSKFFLGRMNYFHVTGQTGNYLARVFAPLVSISTTCNVILAAMQVVLSVQAIYTQDDQTSWTVFAYLSRWFSVAIIPMAAAIAVLAFLMLICGRFIRQLIFASKDLLKKRSKQAADDERVGAEVT